MTQGWEVGMEVKLRKRSGRWAVGGAVGIRVGRQGVGRRRGRRCVSCGVVSGVSVGSVGGG